MNRKAISYALILLGVGAMVLALAQVNTMMITGAQSEISKPLLEEQIRQAEQAGLAQGISQAEIDATSQQARTLVDQSINKVNQAYQQSALIDLVVGLLFMAVGVFVHPREH